MRPLVSVIIVNHNGIEFVDNCLRSVLESRYPDFEVIVVDNASRDGSLEYIKKTFGSDPRLRLVENPGSFGPAVGRNQGARIAKGKHLIFFDNDTQVDKNCINELVVVLENDASIGAGQAKLLQWDNPNFYDCAGDYLGPLGFLIERSRGQEDIGQFDYVSDILSAKSAASIIRRDLFERIGGFDGDFYMYLEETDLSWRVWLSGYRVVFVPKSVVHHAYGTKKKSQSKYYPNYIVRYYGYRNYISTLIKNLSLINIIKIMPLHLSCWLVLSMMFLFKLKFRDFFWIQKAILWNITRLGLLLKKKALINCKIRKVKDSQIMAKIMKNTSLSYYFGKAVSYIYGRPY